MHIPDVDRISDVVVALFCLEVDIRWLVCIQVGCVICIYDVNVVLILDVIPVIGVVGVTEVIDGRVVDGLAVLSADSLELDVDVNREVYDVDSDVNELNDVGI